MKWNIFERFIDVLVGFLRLVLIQLGKNHYFSYVSSCVFILFISISTFFSRFLNFGIHSYTIAIYTKTFTEASILFSLILKNYPKTALYIPDFKKCFENVGKIFIDAI